MSGPHLDGIVASAPSFPGPAQTTQALRIQLETALRDLTIRDGWEQAPPPDRLYYYTTAATLTKIDGASRARNRGSGGSSLMGVS